MNRWLASRWLVVGFVLSILAYIPANVGPNKALWIPVFGGIATVFIGGGMGKNAVDAWRGTGGPPPPPEEDLP